MEKQGRHRKTQTHDGALTDEALDAIAGGKLTELGEMETATLECPEERDYYPWLQAPGTPPSGTGNIAEKSLLKRG